MAPWDQSKGLFVIVQLLNEIEYYELHLSLSSSVQYFFNNTANISITLQEVNNTAGP